MGYILVREVYIANNRNDASETSGYLASQYILQETKDVWEQGYTNFSSNSREHNYC